MLQHTFSKVPVILKMYVATYKMSSQIIWNVLLHNVYHRLGCYFDGWRTRVLRVKFNWVKFWKKNYTWPAFVLVPVLPCQRLSYFKRSFKVFFVVVSSCSYFLDCFYSFKRFNNGGMTGLCVKTLACALLFQFQPMTDSVGFILLGGRDVELEFLKVE